MKKRPRMITAANFARFGQFVPLPPPRNVRPSGSAPKVLDYWKQLVRFGVAIRPEVGLVTVYRRETVFGQVERHRRTPELLVNLDAEVFVPAAPAHRPRRKGDVPFCEDVDIFRVPPHSLVFFPVGAWHWAPFPVTAKQASLVVVFRDDTSQNDMEIVDLPDEISF